MIEFLPAWLESLFVAIMMAIALWAALRKSLRAEIQTAVFPIHERVKDLEANRNLMSEIHNRIESKIDKLGVGQEKITDRIDKMNERGIRQDECLKHLEEESKLAHSRISDIKGGRT